VTMPNTTTQKLFPFVLTKPQDDLAPNLAQEYIPGRMIESNNYNNHNYNYNYNYNTNANANTNNIYNYYSDSDSKNYRQTFATRKTRNARKKGCCCFYFGLGSLATALFCFVVVVTLPQLLSSCLDIVERFQEIDETSSRHKISRNRIGWDGGQTEIAYFQQKASNPTPEHHHAILLHGSGVSNDVWKTSGVLDLFRRLYPSVTVTAVDLPVNADHYQLASLLESMEASGLVESLPVSALVTPSASGFSVTTWIQSDDDDYYEYDDDDDTIHNNDNNIFNPLLWDLPDYVSAWIPVASQSVTDCSDQELERLKNLSHLRVLAIHGDKDTKGKKVSERLFDLTEAQVMELPGEDPVYLKSPMAFVEAIGEEILLSDGR